MHDVLLSPGNQAPGLQPEHDGCRETDAGKEEGLAPAGERMHRYRAPNSQDVTFVRFWARVVSLAVFQDFIHEISLRNEKSDLFPFPGVTKTVSVVIATGQKPLHATTSVPQSNSARVVADLICGLGAVRCASG